MIEQLSRKKAAFFVDHKRSILLLGSCFSDHIGKRLQRSGFDVLSNPFGTVFHPIPLANCLNGSETFQNRFLNNDDVWLSYDASSELYALSENDLRIRIAQKKQQLSDCLQTAPIVIVTLGSAHGYRLNQDGKIVANCHKQPSFVFTKELTDLAEMANEWIRLLNQLILLYPELKVVLTVSPVRYSRDGWVENNRSKARSIQLAELLEKEFSFVEYFPAYELVNDLLRDYRYFEQDGVHPNNSAIDEVWSLFSEWYFSSMTKEIVTEAEQLRKMEEHRLLFPDSRQAEVFRNQLQQKRESFLSLHPYIHW